MYSIIMYKEPQDCMKVLPSRNDQKCNLLNRIISCLLMQIAVTIRKSKKREGQYIFERVFRRSLIVLFIYDLRTVLYNSLSHYCCIYQYKGDHEAGCLFYNLYSIFLHFLSIVFNSLWGMLKSYYFSLGTFFGGTS